LRLVEDPIVRGVADLVRLPWFEPSPTGVRLRREVAGVRGIIDCHSHLALAYVLPMSVDLDRETPRTEHYLPVERDVDLEVYINKNFTPDDLARLTKDLTWKSLTPWGMRATHTKANLTRAMRDLGIVKSVLLPIDFPAISSNARTYLRAVRGRTDLVSFGSIHPLDLAPERSLAAQIALGARGIKVHPAVQLVPPDAPRSIRLFEHCGERGITVFIHCGPVGIEQMKRAREYCQVDRYRTAIERCQKTTFVLGHSGGLQMELALALAKDHPNVWLELASQSLRNIRTIVEEGPVDRVVYGSDWPFYHQAIQIAKVLLATEDRKDVREKVLHDNAARLLGVETPVAVS
jgi:predicted TIM-barrel fold metal-dependent hydrolase